MRSEFGLLDSQFKRLYANVDVNQEFLRKVRSHIELCERIAETDKEKSVLVRTVEWWRKRTTPFGMDMSPKLLSGGFKTPEEIAADDRDFLRSLGIATEEEDEDDGA